MESTATGRLLTFRVENIPPDTTEEELIKYFYTEDQPHVRVRSIVPAVDNHELDIREYTATIAFQARNQSVLSPRLLNEDLSIDGDFHGFTPLNHPQEPIAADIIAVTGLAAHAFGSWAHSTQNMWLRDYLPRDVSNARVLTYGYPSQLHGNISRSILSDHSTNMIHRLLTMREAAKCQDRPIVFIGHSLGCLIIKKVLCDINGSEGIYRSKLPVRSIIFLGAPHKGLETTALETLVKSQATEDMIRELKSESPTLTELNDKFRHVAKNIDILTCYELCPTKTAIKMPDGTWKREGPPIMMVPLDSARQWYPREEFVACNADHAQISKLKRGENSIYPSVRWAIKKALLGVGDLYSEAKGTFREDSGPLGSVGEASRLQQSLLQVSHRPSPVISDVVSAGSALLPPTPPTEDTFDQQIKRLHRTEIDRRSYTRDVQSKTNSSNGLLSQWHPSEASSQQDDTYLEPSGPPGTDIALPSSDEGGAAIETADFEKSLDNQATPFRVSSKESDPEHPAIRSTVNGSATVEENKSSSNTKSTKSMVMDKEMASAIIEGDEQRTRDLLERYDIECKNEDKKTPLLLAARYRHETIVRMLLERGANPRAKCVERVEKSDACYRDYTILHLLAHCHGPPISGAFVDLILRYRPPLDASTDGGITPLMRACRSGEFLLAERLIHHGADVHAVNIFAQNPLHYAVSKGSVAMITLLVDNGININASDDDGKTCLHFAAAAGKLEIVKVLLDHGANPTIKTNGLLGSRPSAISMKNGVSPTQKKRIRDVLKEAEKAWKQSGRK